MNSWVNDKYHSEISCIDTGFPGTINEFLELNSYQQFSQFKYFCDCWKICPGFPEIITDSFDIMNEYKTHFWLIVLYLVSFEFQTFHILCFHCSFSQNFFFRNPTTQVLNYIFRGTNFPVQLFYNPINIFSPTIMAILFSIFLYFSMAHIYGF